MRFLSVLCCLPQGASEEELKRLEKEVREQEQLLTGYQQENERLYKQLKQIQAKEKASEARMFSENQKLGKKKSSCILHVLLLIPRSFCYIVSDNKQTDRQKCRQNQ